MAWRMAWRAPPDAPHQRDYTKLFVEPGKTTPTDFARARWTDSGDAVAIEDITVLELNEMEALKAKLAKPGRLWSAKDASGRILFIMPL